MTGITLLILEYGELVQGVCQPSAHAEISPDRFGDLMMAHILVQLVFHFLKMQEADWQSRTRTHSAKDHSETTRISN